MTTIDQLAPLVPFLIALALIIAFSIGIRYEAFRRIKVRGLQEALANSHRTEDALRQQLFEAKTQAEAEQERVRLAAADSEPHPDELTPPVLTPEETAELRAAVERMTIQLTQPSPRFHIINGALKLDGETPEATARLTHLSLHPTRGNEGA